MIHTIDIESAFAAWLISDKSTVGEDARFARRAIRTMVGNAVFAGRRPPNAHSYRPADNESVELALSLHRPRVNREYLLVGEDDTVQSTVNVVAHSRGSTRPALWAKRLAEFIRIYTGHFQGTWEYASDIGRTISVAISAATITSESELPPVASTKSADRWDYRYSVQWLITHGQKPGVFAPPTSNETLWPPPPPREVIQGVGYDSIGVTQIR